MREIPGIRASQLERRQHLVAGRHEVRPGLLVALEQRAEPAASFVGERAPESRGREPNQMLEPILARANPVNHSRTTNMPVEWTRRRTDRPCR